MRTLKCLKVFSPCCAFGLALAFSFVGCGDDSSSVAPAPVSAASSSSGTSSPVVDPVLTSSDGSAPVLQSSSDAAAAIDPNAANYWSNPITLAVVPDSNGFYDVGDVYKAVPATSKLVFVLRHAEREKSEGQESLLTEKGVQQALSVGAKLAGGDDAFYYSSTDFIRTRETCNNIAKGRGETAYETVTWDGIDGGYFLKVPSDTMSNYARNRGSSWKMISQWAYNDPNVSAAFAQKIPEYFYDLMPRGDQFISEVILANMAGWKRVSVLVTHDILIAPLIIYATNRTIDLKFFESGKWSNYLAGIAVVVDEANTVTLLPVRGVERGYMYTEQRQAKLDSLAALEAGQGSAPDVALEVAP